VKIKPLRPIRSSKARPLTGFSAPLDAETEVYCWKWSALLCEMMCETWWNMVKHSFSKPNGGIFLHGWLPIPAWGYLPRGWIGSQHGVGHSTPCPMASKPGPLRPWDWSPRRSLRTPFSLVVEGFCRFCYAIHLTAETLFWVQNFWAHYFSLRPVCLDCLFHWPCLRTVRHISSRN
jgi:hypothetical protein